MTSWSRDHSSSLPPETVGDEWVIGPDTAGNAIAIWFAGQPPETVGDEWVIGPDAAGNACAIWIAEILAPVDRKYLSASSAKAMRSSLVDPVLVV